MAFMDEFQHLKIQLEEIKLATDNFDDNNLIGNGGFGKVYKGEIFHSKGRSMGAIKRLDSRYGQGNSEFWREIMMLSRYTHENLVSLLGYCDEGGEKILVYEHASHGSLDSHLSATTLTWILRLRICVAAARGLKYLHDPNETQDRVLHRDIKSSNILLDENWNAKVSDFGLSKIGPADLHTVLVSDVVGTLGYLDPLYMEMGWLTKESDVYSLGVVLFEVLCGRLCYEHDSGRVEIFVRLWKQSYKQKKLEEIIDKDLLQQMDSTSLETFSDIAYQCLRRSREKRPTMALVMETLEIALKLQEVYEEAKKRMDYIKEMIQTVQHTMEKVTLDFDSSSASLENQEYMGSQEAHEEENPVDEVHSIISDMGGPTVAHTVARATVLFFGRRVKKFRVSGCTGRRCRIRRSAPGGINKLNMNIIMNIMGYMGSQEAHEEENAVNTQQGFQEAHETWDDFKKEIMRREAALREQRQFITAQITRSQANPMIIGRHSRDGGKKIKRRGLYGWHMRR